MWWLVLAIFLGPNAEPMIARIEIGPMPSLSVCEQHMTNWSETVAFPMVGRCEQRG